MDRRRQWAQQWILMFLGAMFGAFAVHDMLTGDLAGLAKSRDFVITALVGVIGYSIGRPSAS